MVRVGGARAGVSRIRKGRETFLISFLSSATSDEPFLATTFYHRLLRLLLGYVAVSTLMYGLLTFRFYRSWTVADWLINYEGGFVRRGLPGQIAWELGRLCHVSPSCFIALVLLLSYAVLLGAVQRLAWNARPSWWCLALLVSPATLSFQILDVTGGFRKEILFLATLAAVLAGASKVRSLPAWVALAGISMVGTLVVAALVLSHESLICFTPYLVAALCLRARRLRDALVGCALSLAVGLVLAVASLRHLGDAATAGSICASLGYPLLAQGKEVCAGGAIWFLTYTPAMARARAWAAVRDDLYFVVYPLATALAMLPLVSGSIALWRRGWRREIRLVWGAAAFSFLASLPLFVYAEDWGRWIYIHVLSLMLLLLALASRPAEQHAGSKERALGVGRQRPAWWALAAYAALWSLPHVPSRTLPFGYIGLLHYLGLHL